VVETEKKAQNQITGTAVEEAVIGFFEGVNLTIVGTHTKGNQQIEISRDKKKKVLSAIAKVGGFERAVIHFYNNNFRSYSTSAYFRLCGEEVGGKRDEVIFNRGPLGYEHIMFSRVPGTDLINRKVANNETKKMEIAKRLGIGINIPHRLSHNLQ